jgi:hypothetical protein
MGAFFAGAKVLIWLKFHQSVEPLTLEYLHDVISLHCLWWHTDVKAIVELPHR